MSCKICSSEKTTLVCELTETNNSFFEEFSRIKYQSCLEEIVESGIHPLIRHCGNCDFYYYEQMPSDEQLGKMYASGVALYDKGMINKAEKKKEADISHLLERLIRVSNGRTNGDLSKLALLDFGSGSGTLAKIGEKMGLTVTAYEPSLERNTVVDTGRLTFFNNLEDLKTKKYDIIVMNQVMEHVKQPVDTLKTLGSLSHQNTILYVAVPNIKNDLKNPEIWKEWPFNGKSIHIMAPFEHLNGFTPRAFKRAVSSAGLRSVALSKKLSFSPRFTLIDSIFWLTGVGGTARGIFRIKKS